MPLPLPLMVPAAYYYYHHHQQQHQHLLHSSSYSSYKSCLDMPKWVAGTWFRPRVFIHMALSKAQAWLCESAAEAWLLVIIALWGGDGRWRKERGGCVEAETSSCPCLFLLSVRGVAELHSVALPMPSPLSFKGRMHLWEMASEPRYSIPHCPLLLKGVKDFGLKDPCNNPECLQSRSVLTSTVWAFWAFTLLLSQDFEVHTTGFLRTVLWTKVFQWNVDFTFST